MASKMDDTIDGTQTQIQTKSESHSQSQIDKDFVEAVMSPSVVKVDSDPSRRKRPLSGKGDSEDTPKKIKGSGSPKAGGSKSSSDDSSCSNFDIVMVMKAEFSALKSELSTELNQSLDSKFDALGAKIKTAVLEAVKEDIDAVRKEFNDRITGLSSKLETKLTQALQGKVETEVSKVKDAMRAEIRTTDSQMSYAAATTFSVNPLEKNICIRNLNLDSRESTDEQVTLNKVNAIIRDGLKLKDINVVKAVRKATINGKPGVVIASIETLEQKRTIMENKKSLKNTDAFKKVYIEDDRPLQARVAESNMRSILKEIGKSDNYVFANGRLLKKSKKH